jgi:hypothetical protein
VKKAPAKPRAKKAAAGKEKEAAKEPAEGEEAGKAKEEKPKAPRGRKRKADDKPEEKAEEAPNGAEASEEPAEAPVAKKVRLDLVFRYLSRLVGGFEPWSLTARFSTLGKACIQGC